MPVNMHKRLLNDRDSAAYLSICRSKFHSLVKTGLIKPMHIDSSVRYDENAFAPEFGFEAFGVEVLVKLEVSENGFLIDFSINLYIFTGLKSMSVYSKKRKDGTRAWFYDFSHNKVRYRGVGGATKTQAIRTQDKIRTQVLNGEFELQREVRNPKIEEFAVTYLKRRKHLRMHRRDKFLVDISTVRLFLKFVLGI